MNKRKTIQWAYRTSPDAIKFGYGKTGCWVLQIYDANSTVTIGAHSDKEKLSELGNNLPHIPWEETKQTHEPDLAL
jgi:hypothetical protein